MGSGILGACCCGTEESHDGEGTGCPGNSWNKNKSWVFLVLQRPKSAPVAQ